jgi:Phasin protein.
MQQGHVKTYKQWVDLNKSATEYALRFNKVVSGSIERAALEQVEFAFAATEAAVTHAKRLTEVKMPQELLNIQSTLVSELGEKALTTARKLIEIQQETGAELNALWEKGASTFSLGMVTRLTPHAA